MEHEISLEEDELTEGDGLEISLLAVELAGVDSLNIGSEVTRRQRWSAEEEGWNSWGNEQLIDGW